jgi:hypothetical protein
LKVEDIQKPANDLIQEIGRFQAAAAPQTLGEPARFAANLLRMLNAKMANEMLRADAALRPFRNSFDRTPINLKLFKYDPTLPLPRNFAFIDAYEGGDASVLGPTEARAAAEFAKQNDDWLDRIHALGTGALENALTNYFPHLWSDPVKARQVLAASRSKRPLEGSKAFLKQRTYRMFREGLAAGLRPVHDNPVDLWLLKKREVERFIFCHQFMHYMDKAGFLRFVHVFNRGPIGWTEVKDNAFQRWAPPTVTIKEAYDEGMRSATIQVLKDLGIPHERLAKIGGSRWGYATHFEGERGNESVTTKFGGPDFVLFHELGHVLDNRYPELRTTLNATEQMQGELRALADQRLSGPNAPESFKRDVRSMPEKMAVVLQAYLHAPDLMEKIAPTVKLAFTNFLASHPELAGINEIRPSLRLGQSEAQQAVGGMVKLGAYYMPDAAGQVVNNYLSPGLNPFLWYRSFRAVSNMLNTVQLGFSFFHAGFTSMEIPTTHLSLAIMDAVQGRPISAAKTLAFTPASPISNFMQGLKIKREILHPGSQGDDIARLVSLLEAGGMRARMDSAYQTEYGRRFTRACSAMKQAFKDSDFVEAGKSATLAAWNAPWALLELQAAPILKYLVPIQKLGAAAKMAEFEMRRDALNGGEADVRQVMAKVWDSVDNRMGQVVYDNKFYNRYLKDIALLSFRAFGWQSGKFGEGGGAVADAAAAANEGAHGRRPQFTHKMAYVVALPIMVGIIGATLNYLLTGKQPHGRDYFQPRTGETDRNGNPVRLNLPTYMKDVLAYQHHPFVAFAHSLNPAFSTIADLLMNSDYYNTQIHNPNDPALKQGSDTAQYLAKQFMPFSVAGAQNLKENDAPAWKALAPFFGITPVSTRMTMSPAQELAAEITAAAMPRAPMTQDQANRSKLIRTIVQDIKTGQKPAASGALKGGLQSGIINDGAVTTLIDKLQYTPLQFQVHHMDPNAAMQVWRVANPAERAQIQPIVQAKVTNSKTLDTAVAKAYLKEIAK